MTRQVIVRAAGAVLLAAVVMTFSRDLVRRGGD